MTLSASTLSGYFCRLHQKFTRPDELFDVSWTGQDLSPRDLIRWEVDRLGLSVTPARVGFTFEHVIERLVLLPPDDLQKLLCGAGALAIPTHFRHCINGTLLRELQTTIGATAYNHLMNRLDINGSFSAQPEWSVESLCRDGWSQLLSHSDRKYPLVICLLKAALPKHFGLCAATGFPKIQPASFPWDGLKALYPEFRWLFG